MNFQLLRKILIRSVCMHSYEQTGSGWKGKVMDTRSFIKEKIFEEDIKPLVENNILSVNKKITRVEDTDLTCSISKMTSRISL